MSIHLFEIEGGAAATIFNIRGEAEMQVHARREGETLVVKKQGSRKPWTVCLRGIRELSAVKGASYKQEAAGVVLFPEGDADSLVIRL